MDTKLLLRQEALLNQLATSEVLKSNELTAPFGLILSPLDAAELVKSRADVLRKNGRIELAGGAITKLIENFCDSPYLDQSNYAATLTALIETFYYFKNETLDQISDDDLLRQMKKYFDGSCQGSIELLQNRELPAYARSIRYGRYYDPDTSENPAEYRKGGIPPGE
jgi:hypothetical protein